MRESGLPLENLQLPLPLIYLVEALEVHLHPESSLLKMGLVLLLQRDFINRLIQQNFEKVPFN